MTEPTSRATSAAARSKNVVHLQARNHSDAARLLAPSLDRAVGATDHGPAVLVLVPSADDALRIAEDRARGVAHSGGRLLIPVTSPSRGRRQVVSGTAALIGTPGDLFPLLRESKLRLGGLLAVALVWPEELLGGEQAAALESLLAEVPREAERSAVVARPGSEVDAFLERIMWRARRIDHCVPADGVPVRVRFLSAPPGHRVSALRAVLDATDPETVALVVSSDDAEAAATLAAGIFGSESAGIRVIRGMPTSRVSLAVLFMDVPAPDSLRVLTGVADDIVAIVDPARIPQLRINCGGGAVPVSWTGSLAHSRTVLDALRDSLRAAVRSGAHIPWMAVVEPLLTELDAVEVAASSLVLLERERQSARASKVAPTSTREAPGRTGVMTARREGHREAPSPARRDGDRKPSAGAGRAGHRGAGRPESPASRRERPPGKGDTTRGRRGMPERLPRAAREHDEWAGRGERLRHSRRSSRDRTDS